jgi:hypothetical protein
VVTHLIDAFNVLESVNKAMGEWMEESIASHNLTVLDFRILDGLAQGAVATTSQCSSHLSTEKLEKAGFVQRRRDRPDRRMVALQLSDEGLELYELALHALNERWQDLLGDVGTDVMQLAALFAGPTRAPIGALIKNSLREKHSTVK